MAVAGGGGSGGDSYQYILIMGHVYYMDVLIYVHLRTQRESAELKKMASGLVGQTEILIGHLYTI